MLFSVRKGNGARDCSPEDVMETCALFHSRRAARAITGHFDRHLKAAGIKATHFSLLVAVANAPGRPLSEIAAYMAMDRTALARELRMLEDLHLLKIETPKNDRRTRLMTLTAKGERTMATALPYWRNAQDRIETVMAAGPWTHVRSGMEAASNL